MQTVIGNDEYENINAPSRSLWLCSVNNTVTFEQEAEKGQYPKPKSVE